MDPVAERDQVWVARWQEMQDQVVKWSRCRVAAHNRVCMQGLRWFTTKPSGYFVEPQNQVWRFGGRRRDLGPPRSFDAGGHATGSWALRREDADCGEGVIAR
jgi:hypothetical protein